MDSFIGTSKSLQMVYRKQFSQSEYVIIFHIAKTYTTVCPRFYEHKHQQKLHWSIQYSVHIHRAHNITVKILSINCQKLGSLDTGQFTIFLVVRRWREELYKCQLSSHWSVPYVPHLSYSEMEIYNSFQSLFFENGKI